MTFTVLLEMTLRDDATNAAEIAREVLAQTAARDGSEGVEVVIDDADPMKWIVIERWSGVAAREAYMEWRATPEGANRLGEILSAPPSFRTFERSVPLA